MFVIPASNKVVREYLGITCPSVQNRHVIYLKMSNEHIAILLRIWYPPLKTLTPLFVLCHEMRMDLVSVFVRLRGPSVCLCIFPYLVYKISLGWHLVGFCNVSFAKYNLAKVRSFLNLYSQP